jgi:hypothetical protein
VAALLHIIAYGARCDLAKLARKLQSCSEEDTIKKDRGIPRSCLLELVLNPAKEECRNAG